MDTYAKIRIKLFILNIIFELIVNSIILSVAYLTDKFLIVCLFYIPFHFLRNAVPKVFHVSGKTPILNIIGCAVYSCICYFVAMKLMFPVNIKLEIIWT